MAGLSLIRQSKSVLWAAASAKRQIPAFAALCRQLLPFFAAESRLRRRIDKRGQTVRPYGTEPEGGADKVVAGINASVPLHHENTAALRRQRAQTRRRACQHQRGFGEKLHGKMFGVMAEPFVKDGAQKHAVRLRGNRIRRYPAFFSAPHNRKKLNPPGIAYPSGVT